MSACDVLILASGTPGECAGAAEAALALGSVTVCGPDDDQIREAVEGAGASYEACEGKTPAWIAEHALERAGGSAPWILVLTSEERVTPALAAQVLSLDGSSPARAYAIVTRTLFMGKALSRGGFGPRRRLRVIRRGCATLGWWKGEPVLKPEAPDIEPGAGPGAGRLVGRLGGQILRVLDMPSRELLGRWIEQTDEEMVLAQRGMQRGETLGVGVGRRFGATLHFVRRYLFQAGFLDGRAGFHRAMLEANRKYIARMLLDERMSLVPHEPADPETVYGKEVSAQKQPAPGWEDPPQPDPAQGLHPVSVLILTKDEEINIADCIARLSFSDDIVVYDSLSTDRTVEIAKGLANVRVISRKFDNWSTHQNWAVRNIEFKHPWVLYVDADERVTPRLAKEIMERCSPDAPENALRMRRKDIFMGRWIKHAQLYPTWISRVFRPEMIRYERLVNPVAIVEGVVGDLEKHLIHYPFSKGIVHWFERHNSYSGFEAEEQLKVQEGRRRPIRHALSKDPSVRRAALKDMFYRLPMRAEVKWLYYVIWRRAFLDGRAGMTYARLQSIYEHMIRIKADELRKRRSGEQI